MDSVGTYATSTAAWLTLQAIPLFLSPKLIVTILSPDARLPTDLETYLTTTLSLTLLTLSLLTILLTGLLPLTSSPLSSPSPPSPYAHPTILLTTTFHIASTVCMYVQYTTGNGGAGFALGLVGSAGLAGFGIWCLVFGGEEGGRGRVSGWPFRNVEERRWKRERMGGRKGL
ncbi:hypothetical protein BDR22DRAFT_838347 [Usnea florida]